MRHNNSVLMAVSKTPNETVFQKTFSLNDFYFGTEEWHYPLGHIQMLVKSDAEMLRAEAPEWVFWRPVMPLDILAKHALDFWLTSEDLPDPGSRM
jgi:hypothetical protein